MIRERVAGSFRDPAGVVFQQDGTLYRQIQSSYAAQYRRLIESGLYAALRQDGLIIPHEETTMSPMGEDGWLVIRPERVAIISYPYEWSFSQLRDAALATLRIQEIAQAHGMTLKDASAYNIQFHHGRPLLIDTLSFDDAAEGAPWVAYRQFCQHFVAPLALMSHVDVRLAELLRPEIDGIPLDLAAKLLPWTDHLNLGLAMHIFAHASFQQRYADHQPGHGHGGPHKPQVSQLAARGLVDSLRETVEGMALPSGKGTWTEYYEATNYSDTGFSHKHELVEAFLEATQPALVWDLGANTGEFSRLASQRGIETVAFDLDPLVVEACYRKVKDAGETHLLPLVINLVNPSPALGWAHHERASLLDRGPVDAVLALALIHHLAIGNNVPFRDLAAFFSRCGRQLCIEFVPRGDSQVERLLATREDIFTHYTREDFEAAFAEYFTIQWIEPVRDTVRVMYFMERKDG